MKLAIYAGSVNEAMDQVHRAQEHGITDFLLAPPFFYKGCGDDGLFAWHADLIAKADPGVHFILYHIPQVTGVPLSAELVGRLYEAFPDRIAAIKDSSGSWANAEALLSLKGLPVLIGDERLLPRALRQGAAGSITGMANLYPARLVTLFETAKEDTALSGEVARIDQHPVVPAIKARLFQMTGEPAWNHVRPPLVSLDAASRSAISA